MSNPDTTRIFNYPEVTTPASDAKILLDSQTVGSKCIDANLFHCDLIDKTITQRGTFEASEDDADGFKKVVVDIPYTDVHVASGAVASFEGEDLPLKSLIVDIEPVQSGSGEPSPTNIRPISGWTGAKVENGGNSIWTGESSYTRSNAGYISSEAVTLSANKTYVYATQTSTADLPMMLEVFKNNSTSWQDRIYQSSTIYSKDGLNIFSFSLSEAGTNLRIYTDSPSGITINNVKLFENPSTYTIPLGSTIYGGQLDVIKGTLTVTHISKVFTGDNDTENWDKLNGCYTIYVENIKQGTSASEIIVISDTYKAVGVKYRDDVPNNCIAKTAGANNQIAIKDTSIDTIANWRTYLSTHNVTICYELATPQTIQLTPTAVRSLLGSNNIFADSGEVDVEYQTVWVRPSE